MTTTVGRNAPCPCGSGKKYKHCCAAKAQRTPLGTRVLGSLIALALFTAAAVALLSFGDLIR
ncbi:MAG TPA: SEC-C metal-binding domain-containing protein [Gammaproteobacteria bacterium]|nr:SEC-C metal-binding domain-containing protein [Gammaproteobacteria bacterium]